MKIQTGILFSALLSLFLVFAGLNDAEARRFGGGSSFGGSPNTFSHSTTATSGQTIASGGTSKLG
jgi:hypothetical protein